MIEVLLSWGLISVTAFITGFSLLTVFRRCTGYAFRDPLSCLYAGIGILTVYAELFSIFGKVAFASDLILIISCVILCLIFRKEFQDYLSGKRRALSEVSVGRLILPAALILIFALGSSAGYMHYDSDLYHAQSIRWIEEYGVVPGLGNLQSRLAYNSAAFPLTALFGFAYVSGRSLHTVAGFMALLLALLCTRLIRADLLRRPEFADPVRIAAVYYLCNVFDEMTAPASDYFIVLGAFALVILWIDVAERETDSNIPYILLSLFALVIVSYKLSAALLVLLALKPGVRLLKERRYRTVGICILLGILTVAPFLIRNVILSGYPVYPATGLDPFHFDFKIPHSVADYDSKEIRVYARGYIDISRFEEPMKLWFPAWFRNLGTVDKGAFLAAALSIPVTVIMTAVTLIKQKREQYDRLFLNGVMSICFLFWMLNAPLVRYGCVFLYLCPVLSFTCLTGSVPEGIRRSKALRYGYGILFVLFIAYKAVFFGKGILTMVPRYRDHLIRQQDYGDYSDIAGTYEINGRTFYYPTEGDRMGYDLFPSSTVIRDIRLRGENLGDGFYDPLLKEEEESD